MSTVFDVSTVAVSGLPPFSVDAPSTMSIEVTVPQSPSITVMAESAAQVVQVTTAGPQGLQNVYVQDTNPATQYGWGPEQANFIWIRPV